MQYLGGKFRIRKWLAEQIAPYRTPGHILWEPFCGGLNASEALLPDICSDVDASLIALYQAVRAGWEPPVHVDEELYAFARTLPESNPLHGFCAFGCSHSGRKWGGFAKDNPAHHAFYARAAATNLTRASKMLQTTVFYQIDFFTIDPFEIEADLYCDSPYRNTAGYTQDFDSDRFIAYAQEWARFTSVFVSEYAWPAWAGIEIASCLRDCPQRRKGGKGATAIERLFLVTP